MLVKENNTHTHTHTHMYTFIHINTCIASLQPAARKVGNKNTHIHIHTHIQTYVLHLCSPPPAQTRRAQQTRIPVYRGYNDPWSKQEMNSSYASATGDREAATCKIFGSGLTFFSYQCFWKTSENRGNGEPGKRRTGETENRGNGCQ
jgi:hypothetical protein